MAIVIEGGAEAFRHLAYQPPHPDTYAFLDKFNSNFTASVQTAVAGFFDVAGTIYDRVTHSDAMRMARAFGRQVSSIWQSNTFRPLREMGEFQNAPDVMVRWLAAEPLTRAMMHAQQCDGWSDRYIDAAPNDVGEKHYDYRRVMDGMMQEGDDGEFFFDTYYEDIIDPADDLVIGQQLDIITSWEFLQTHMRTKKEDPTSAFAANL